MAHPQYPLLDTHYDNHHRAHLMVDLGEDFGPLRPRTHAPLRWDERYAPYLRRAGFLSLARAINAGLPDMDGSLITALVDRWRPETHSFHLPCGEMTVTLQDVAYILGLAIDGLAVTGVTDTENWKDLVHVVTGRRPPDPEEGKKEKKTSGVSSNWLRQYFDGCPANAPEEVVERHARVWMWHMVASFLLPDASGNTVSWMVLPQLSQPWENIAEYSWGTATLAWLYRQLCEACTRTKEASNITGCTYLLQIWIWERLPIGRVHRNEVPPWTHDDCRPPVCYLWQKVVSVRGQPKRRYIQYSNDMDVITPGQVEWSPYDRAEIEDLQIAPICTRDSDLWRCDVPMVLYYVVEWHLPCRVMKQFGRRQHFPIEHASTSRELHSVTRKKRFSSNDWRTMHAVPLHLWEGRQRTHYTNGPVSRPAEYREYLVWLHRNTRMRVRPSITNVPIDEGDSDDDDPYDEITRLGVQPERAPLENYMSTQLAYLSNEAGVYLGRVGGVENTLLEGFAKKVMKTCRRMARKFSCVRAEDVINPSRAPLSGRRLPLDTPESSRARQRDGDNDEGDDDDDDGGDPSYDPQELSGSQLRDAPQPTQMQASQQHDRGAPARNVRARRHRDRTDVGTANVLPTNPGRERRRRQPFSPNP